MRKIRLALLGLALPTIALADPATPLAPPAYSEKDFRAIGGGLFLARGLEFTNEDHDNVSVPVYSRAPINIGERYSLDLSRWIAQAPDSERRTALGLGMSLGAYRAFGAAFSRITDTYAFLGNVQEMMTNPAASAPLWAAGINPSGKTQDVALAYMDWLRKKAVATPTNQLGLLNQQYGNDIDLGTLMRLRALSADEYRDIHIQFTIDAGKMAGLNMRNHVSVVDAGALGMLRVQDVTLDCANRTYEIVNTRKLIPDFIWRPASTLPVLTPVFKYVCHALKEVAATKAEAARQASIDAAERAREFEANQAAAEEAQRVEIQQQAAARYDEMPAEYQQARKQSGYGARFAASGFMQFPIGGKDGVCSRLLVENGWSKPLADVACHEQSVKECAASLTTESVRTKDMPLVSTAVATSTEEVCARVRSITNPARHR